MTAETAAYAENINGAHVETETAAAPAMDTTMRDTAIATVATVGVVAVGAVLIEATLIPGLALGVVAALAPQYAPKLGSAITPMLRSTVRGVYKLGRRSREMFSEMQEHIGDIAAEVHAEDAHKPAETVQTAAETVVNEAVNAAAPASH